MQLLNLCSAIIVLLPLEAVGLLYWVDTSCSNRPGWPAFMEDTKNMATQTEERLNSQTDTDFEAIFNRIFKTAKADQAGFTKVINVVGGQNGIKTWTQTQDQHGSHLRIYCDNDRRWRPRPAGGWIDEQNLILLDGPDPPACQDQTEDAAGESYRYLAPEPGPLQNGQPDPRAGQPTNRNTMTICDVTFTVAGEHDSVYSLQQLAQDDDLSQLDGIEDLEFLVCLTIFHEWTHHRQYNLDDPFGADSYEWHNVATMARAASLNNADSYAYLGLWAIMAERIGPGRGFTMPRAGNPPDPNVVRQQVYGKIAKYDNITKRWLKNIAKLFKA